MSEQITGDAYLGNPFNIIPGNTKSIGRLAGALAKAQAAFKPVKKTIENVAYFNEKTGKKNYYADLAAIIDATQLALASNELAVIQLPVIDHERHMAGVKTVLVHSSGETIETELLLPAIEKRKDWAQKNAAGQAPFMEVFNAQTIGIAITYARRYSYQSIVGVAAEQDTDANEISIEPGSTEAAQAVAEKKIQDHIAKTGKTREQIEQETRRAMSAPPRAEIPTEPAKAPENGQEALAKANPEKVVFFSYPFGNTGDICLAGPYCKDVQFTGAMIFNFGATLDTEGETWRIPGRHSIALFDMFRNQGVTYKELVAGTGTPQGEVRRAPSKIVKSEMGKGKASNCLFVELENGEKFSCWDKKLFDYLNPGERPELIVEPHGKYVNIKGIRGVE